MGIKVLVLIASVVALLGIGLVLLNALWWFIS